MEPFWVAQALASVSSMRNWAGSPASSLEAETIVAPLDFEARFGATLSVRRLVAPAPIATALKVCAP